MYSRCECIVFITPTDVIFRLIHREARDINGLNLAKMVSKVVSEVHYGTKVRIG